MIYGADAIISAWVCKRNESAVRPHPDDRALGVMVGDRIVAGVTYGQLNGPNVVCEIAANAGSMWATRPVLRRLFWYPFVDLGCTRITIAIEEGNQHSLRTCRHLGFIEEARLHSAASDHGDVIILRMFKEECRWIEAPHGEEAEGTGAA